MSFFSKSSDRKAELQKELDQLNELDRAKQDKADAVELFDITAKKGLTDLSGFFMQWKKKHNQQNAMLINMELSNGDETTFIAIVKDNKFIYENKMYIIDDQAKRWNHTAKLYSMFYHQDISMPIITSVNVTELKKAIQKKGITDVDQAINPRNLREFVNSDIISKIFNAVELDKVFRFLKLMMIIILVVLVIFFLLWLNQTGALRSMLKKG